MAVPTAPEVGVATETFLDVLRSEQFRYLDAMAEANEILRTEPGRVALIAALQNRLTQQFFDAQRSIIMRQAVYDVEVQRIEARAETDVQGIVAAARSRIRALAAAGVPLAPPAGSPAVDAPAPEPGVALARRTEEALAGLPDAAFVASEPDPDAVQRQLGALLDQWWSALNQDGQAQIDHAHARAAMRRHVAAIESGVMEMPPPRSAAAHIAPTRPAAAQPAAPVARPALDPPSPSVPSPSVPVASVPAPVPAASVPAPSAQVASLPAPVVQVTPIVAPAPGTIVVSADLPSKLLRAIESAPIADLRLLLESLEGHFQQTAHRAPAAAPVQATLAPPGRVMPSTGPTGPTGPTCPAAISAQVAQVAQVAVPSDDLVIRSEPVDRDPLARLGALEPVSTSTDLVPASGFWSESRSTSVVDRINQVVPVRVVLPMIAATSAITLVLALVG